MRIYINKQTIFWILLVAPFIHPNGIPNISGFIDKIYVISMVISLIILLFIYVNNSQKYFFFIILFSILLGWILFVTIIRRAAILTIGKIALMLFGTSLCVEVMIYNPRRMFVAFLTNLEAVIYINFVLLLRYPDGLYISETTGNWNNWLLGYDNHWFIVFFVAYYLAVMNYIWSGNWIRSFLLILVIHISTCITMSGVLIVGILIMDVCFLFKIYKWKFFDMKLVLMIGIISFLLITFLSNSSLVDYIVYTFLEKTNSLSSRLKIWSTTWNYIWKNPFWGYGRLSVSQRISMYHNSHGSNAHSMWLEILFEGGVVAFMLFLSILIMVYKKISLLPKTSWIGIWNVAFLACIITLTVDNAFEMRGSLFFFLLSVGYHMKNIEQVETFILE